VPRQTVGTVSPCCARTRNNIVFILFLSFLSVPFSLHPLIFIKGRSSFLHRRFVLDLLFSIGDQSFRLLDHLQDGVAALQIDTNIPNGFLPNNNTKSFQISPEASRRRIVLVSDCFLIIPLTFAYRPKSNGVLWRKPKPSSTTLALHWRTQKWQTQSDIQKEEARGYFVTTISIGYNTIGQTCQPPCAYATLPLRSAVRIYQVKPSGQPSACTKPKSHRSVLYPRVPALSSRTARSEVAAAHESERRLPTDSAGAL
jgi:hypothetical protein